MGKPRSEPTISRAVFDRLADVAISFARDEVKMKNTVPISGVHLVKIGEYVIVNVEIDGKWIEVIKEHESGSFSHICEPAGIRRRQELQNANKSE